MSQADSPQPPPSVTPASPGPEPKPAEPPVADWRSMHLWQIQPVRDVLVIVMVLGLVYLGATLSIVTVPLLLALAIAYLVEPVVGWAESKLHVSRPVAAISLILLFITLIVGPLTFGVALGVGQGARYAQSLSENVDMLKRSVDDPENGSLRNALPGESWKWIRDKLVDQERRAHFKEVQDAAHDALIGAVRKDASKTPAAADTSAETSSVSEFDGPSAVYEVVRWSINWLRANAETLGKQALSSGWDAIGAATRTVTSVGVFVFQSFLALFFFFFFCSGWGKFRVFCKGLVPKESRSRVIELVRKMDNAIAAFIRGRLTICGILMVFYSLAYYFIGVPAPLILGPIVAILALFPYISSLGVPIAIFLLWLEPNPGIRDEWWWTLFMPMAVFTCAQLLDDYVLTPAIQGKHTDMSTPVILFASVAGGALGGFYGLLIAIPCAACLKILVTDVFLPRVKAWSEGKVADVLPFGQR